ncbi:MAG: endo-1,4-beta-xylanase [Lachnospiraceae bacterium]|nr:endo-1,4-beta-xylanase [Lachnospiraceae bacterium]
MRKWKLGLCAVVLVLSMAACATEEAKTPEATPTVTQAPEPTATPAPTATSKPVATPTPTPIVVEETIRSVFGEYGLKAGTCMSEYMVSNAECLEIIKTNFNSITFENEMKPDYILDQAASKATGDLVVKFPASTEKMLKWCSDNDMAVRGHTFVWHSQTPSWIFYDNFDVSGTLVSREVMLARMESFIRQTFELIEIMGYSEMFYAYDVVNEAWMEDGTKRDSLWLQTIGDDYLWQAFYFADKYAPEHIDLYYNDYNEQFKTETLYNFAQTLVDEDGNYLIDGIGFQAHLYTEDSLEDYFVTVDRIASLGLKVNLTELDVCLGKYQYSQYATDANLKVQGQFYYNLIEGLLSRIEAGTLKSDSLTIWGFADQLSWRREYSPLLFNLKMKPKYAYYAVLQLKEYAGFDE